MFPFSWTPALLLPYRCARFTPPGAKYLILDDFHFRIDPQIINYNGLSFHTSMGLLELGRAAVRRPLGRPPGLGAQPRPGGLSGGGLAPAWRLERGWAGLGPCRRRPTAQAPSSQLRQLSNHNHTISAKTSPRSMAICWSVIRAFSLKPTFRWAWTTRSHVLLRLKIRKAQACLNLNHISGNLREEQLKGAHWVGHGYYHDHQLLQESHTCWY